MGTVIHLEAWESGKMCSQMILSLTSKYHPLIPLWYVSILKLDFLNPKCKQYSNGGKDLDTEASKLLIHLKVNTNMLAYHRHSHKYNRESLGKAKKEQLECQLYMLT